MNTANYLLIMLNVSAFLLLGFNVLPRSIKELRTGGELINTKYIITSLVSFLLFMVVLTLGLQICVATQNRIVIDCHTRELVTVVLVSGILGQFFGAISLWYLYNQK